MPFVLDASVTACGACIDEDRPAAAQALDRLRTYQARVPALWWFKARKTLLVNERRGRLAESDTAIFLNGLATLSIITDRAPDETTGLAFGRRYRLSVYGASYLELAAHDGVCPATLDAELVTAARAEKVQLLDTGMP